MDSSCAASLVVCGALSTRLPQAVSVTEGGRRDCGQDSGLLSHWDEFPWFGFREWAARRRFGRDRFRCNCCHSP